MRIIGTGSALPKFTVTNDDLAKFLDTSDEWISTRTGIRSRQIITTETLDGLAYEACTRALDDAGLTAADIDFIICSTVQGEWITPGMSCAIQERLGIPCCPCIDINVACAGFIYALDIADCYINAGRAHNVLVFCAEAMSRIANWADRSNCVLFGDGAGAAVVTQGEGLMKTRLTSRGNVGVLYQRTSRGSSPYAADRDIDTHFHMKGQDVYKSAVTHSAEDLFALLNECGLKPDQVDHYLMHQANLRIIEAVRSRLGVERERMPHNIERTGNSSSASCAILLDEQNRSGALKNGDILALSAFGAGFVTAAALLRWNK